MVKHLSVDDISSQVKDFLKHIDVEKGGYVLDIAGKPIVGVVPHWQVEKLSQDCEKIIKLLNNSWERNRTVAEDEVEQAVKEAIHDVRLEKGKNSK